MNTQTGASCATQCAETQTLPTTRRTNGPTYRPSVDIIESANDFSIVADVPGARPDSIDVTLEAGVLTLKAEVPPRTRPGARSMINEYGVGNYERSFRLGDGIEAEKIAATLKDGVLTLRLPKAETSRLRKVQVRTS